jgi:hypothetical protein
MPQRGASEEHCDPFQENVAFTFAPKYVLYPLPVRTRTLRSRSPARRPVCRCRDATDRDNKRSLLRPGEPRGSERLHQPPHTRHPRHSDPPPTQQVLSPNTIPGGAKRVAVHSLAGPWYHTPMSMLPISRVPIRRTLSSKVKVARTFF